uniref:hypothetical protein n=1 Tax=Kordia periserrulae TaxID=701523 RepID=UPI003743575B
MQPLRVNLRRHKIYVWEVQLTVHYQWHTQTEQEQFRINGLAIQPTAIQAEQLLQVLPILIIHRQSTQLLERIITM